MNSHRNPGPGPGESASQSLLFLVSMLLLAGCRPEGGDSTGSPTPPENPANSGGAGTGPDSPGFLPAGFIASIDREGGFVTFEARETEGAQEGEFVMVFRDGKPIARLQVFEVDDRGARAKVLSGLAEIEIDDPVRKPREDGTPGWPFGLKG